MFKKREDDLSISDNSNNLDWIEKDRLAGIKLNEMRANAIEASILFEISSKILRRLIIEGIDIGLEINRKAYPTQ